VTSGVRLGSAAATTRGFGQDEFQTVGRCIVETLQALATPSSDSGVAEVCVRAKIRELCTRFSDLPERRGLAAGRRNVASRIGATEEAEEEKCAVRFAEPTIPR